jgi:DNA-binding CsgD family transcriptional regulator
VDAFRRSGDTSRLPEAYLISVVTAHLGAGRLDEAAAAASRGYEANALVQSEEGIATFAMLRGWLHVEQGSLGEAARLFREGAAVNRDLKDVSALRWCIGGTALACGMADDAGGAAAAVAELDTIPPHWMDALDSDLVLRGRAWAAAAGGELTTAEKLLRESAATARRREQPYAEARLLHDLARLGAPAEAAARLHDLAASVDGALVPAFAAHAAALVAGDAAGLERAAGTFEDLGALGLAAETYRSASLAYAGEGLARASNAHARKAAELAERCGGAVAPGVTGGREASRLTRREREIAALAASGLSSREIGERLFISARTVENHLASTYLKLGVSAREELAGALKGS